MHCGEMVRVLEVMKTHFQKVSPNAPLSEALDLMDVYQVSALPVVDSTGVVVGMISESDVLLAILSKNVMLERDSLAHWKQAGVALVSEWMMAPAVVASEYEDVHTALFRMIEKGLKRLPVLTEQGQLIGILHRVDILQAIFEGVV
jgi:CBS domain-containing protein